MHLIHDFPPVSWCFSPFTGFWIRDTSTFINPQKMRIFSHCTKEIVEYICCDGHKILNPHKYHLWLKKRSHSLSTKGKWKSYDMIKIRRIIINNVNWYCHMKHSAELDLEKFNNFKQCDIGIGIVLTLTLSYIYILYIYTYSIYIFIYIYYIYLYTYISTVTWQTINEHIVAYALRSEKSSSTLLAVHEEAITSLTS